MYPYLIIFISRLFSHKREIDFLNIWKMDTIFHMHYLRLMWTLQWLLLSCFVSYKTPTPSKHQKQIKAHAFTGS